MKYEATLFALVGLATARDVPVYRRGVAKREVPQEHSHQAIVSAANDALQLDNPLEIQDSVFGLLGNAAAAEGAPNVQNLDCLQQIIADQAFTNAKAAGDVDAMANAVLFRALERNTGSVGLASVLCNEQAVNPEIAAITQHQDPASEEAAGNKDIALAVALQLSSFGADPTLAIQTGTFAPGDVDDNTGAGNTCDDENDAAGCIISQNLLVPDVSADEITAAVSGAGGAAAGAANANVASAGAAANASAASAGAAANAAAGAANASAGAADAANANAADASDANADAAGAAAGTNVQSFAGALGGAAPPVIEDDSSDRPFSVDGSTFVNAGAALQRSCSVQHNACANAANSGQVAGGTAACEQQQDDCNAAAQAQKKRLARKARRSSPAPVFGRKRRFAPRQQALDTGSCGSPAIQFAAGLDGRKEESFQAVNQADFNHGSALNIGVISDFICSKLASSCDAGDATAQACDAASTAAKAATGQAAADAFNSALGAQA